MKLEWQNAPATTWWGHDMVVATVALGKDHSVDLFCARSKTAEAEALLKKPWVGLTDEEIETLIHRFDGDPHTLLDEVNARLKGKNT